MACGFCGPARGAGGTKTGAMQASGRNPAFDGASKPEIRGKESKNQRQQEEHNGILVVHQQRDGKGQQGRHSQSCAKKDVHMSRFAIAGQH